MASFGSLVAGAFIFWYYGFYFVDYLGMGQRSEKDTIKYAAQGQWMGDRQANIDGIISRVS